jgi:glycosyltransferase involved in cell wall biosynthesis
MRASSGSCAGENIVRISIVVPCFNEEEVLGETARRLVNVLGRLVAAGKLSADSNIWFVDDGSRDRTWQLIEKLCLANAMVRGVKLSRNRGHQNALVAGLFSADGDAVISMDADLQDDIEVIEQMVDQHRQGAEIVYGVRRRRDSDTLFKRATADLFYRLMHKLGAESIHNHADFRLMSRRAVEALSHFREVNLFLRGIVPLLGFRTSIVQCDRGERVAGESKYPLKKMIEFALEGITSFSIVPLRLIAITGFAVFALTLVLTAWVLWIRIFTNRAVPGWASTVLPLYFVGGIQILCLGIIGEYLGKIYIEVKARPRYVIERLAGQTGAREIDEA